MKTECTINIGGFRFTITGKRDSVYVLNIEQPLPWGEVVEAYATLTNQNGIWQAKDMTFEEAHDECVLANFFQELYKIKSQSYPEAVQYYEANRQPDIFEIADKILANRKAI